MDTGVCGLEMLTLKFLRAPEKAMKTHYYPVAYQAECRALYKDSSNWLLYFLPSPELTLPLFYCRGEVVYAIPSLFRQLMYVIHILQILKTRHLRLCSLPNKPD